MVKSSVLLSGYVHPWPPDLSHRTRSTGYYVVCLWLTIVLLQIAFPVFFSWFFRVHFSTLCQWSVRNSFLPMCGCYPFMTLFLLHCSLNILINHLDTAKSYFEVLEKMADTGKSIKSSVFYSLLIFNRIKHKWMRMFPKNEHCSSCDIFVLPRRVKQACAYGQPVGVKRF